MAGTTPGRYRDALRSRDLTLLLSAFLCDAVGSWAYSVVLVVYVYDQTGSPAAIALSTACGWVPRLLVSTYAGVLADRYERTRIMTASAAACAVLQALLAVLVARDTSIAPVLVLAALTSACSAFYGPAARAVVPEAVPEQQLASANALFGVLENLVIVIGPAIGGLLLLVGEPVVGVGFNALSFVASASLVRLLSLRSTGGAQDGEGLLTQLKDGVAALRAEQTALVLVLYCALDSAVYGALTVLYLPLSESFGTGSSGYSYLVASMAAGGVLAGGLVNRLAASGRLAPVIVGGMAALALPVAVSAAISAPLPAALLQGVAGVGMVIVDVLAITALQRDLPKAVLSRVFGILDTAVLAGTVLASALTSLLLSLLSLDATLVVVGVGFTVAAVLGMRPLLRADADNAAALAALQPRIRLLEVLDLFAASPRTTLEQLARSVEEVDLAIGVAVVREGDPADALYVVVSGELEVTARGEGQAPHVLRTLGARSYFGEIGLLRGTARTATVTTAEPTVLWRLSGADFLSALETSAPSTSMLALAGSRLARSHPVLAAEPFEPPGVRA